MNFLKCKWERDYLTAIREPDNIKLAERIARAESTILARVKKLNMGHGGSLEEWSSISTALSGLLKLRIERLGL